MDERANPSAYEQRGPTRPCFREDLYALTLNTIRRVATRYDKLDGRYQAFVASASSSICLA